MKQKYLIPTIISGGITALFMYLFIRTINDDSLIFVTMPQLMISGIITFLLAKWAYKRESMDYIAYDYLPVVGPLYPWSKNTFVVSGFKKWGLSLSMVSANLIVDII